MPDQRLFTSQSEPACGSAGGDDQSLGENLFFSNLQCERTFAQVGTDYVTQLIAGTEPSRLGAHVFNQRWSLDTFRESREILHQRGERELASGLVPFQHQ